VSSSPSLLDFGFESVRVAKGDFTYGPTGSAWAFSGLSGLASNGSGFTNGNPESPEGSQVAFVQQGGSISQAVSGWAAGSYTVTFQAAQRGNKFSDQDFQVIVDGAAVGTFRPSGTVYQSFTTASFTVGDGPHTVTFRGLNSRHGDNTSFIDNVSITSSSPPPPPATSAPAPSPSPQPTSSAPAAGDAGFEAVRVAEGDFAYDPNGSAWAFSGLSGLASDGSGFTNGNPGAPEGSQVAFLQQGGSISQAVSGWAAGSYTVTFQAAQRGNRGSNHDFQVLVDNAVVGTFKPSGTIYQSYTTASFTVGAGPHTVTFRGLNSQRGDNTSFVDKATINIA